MSSLETKMKQYGAELSVPPMPKTLAGMVDVLGGTGHAAELMGVNQRTVQRWIAAETGSAKQQRPKGAEAARGKLSEYAKANLEDRKETLRENLKGRAQNGFGVNFEGHVQISNKSSYREIRARIGPDTVRDFDEKLDKWINQLQKHQWKKAADTFNDMFFEGWLDDEGLAKKSAIEDYDELYLYTESNEL